MGQCLETPTPILGTLAVRAQKLREHSHLYIFLPVFLALPQFSKECLKTTRADKRIDGPLALHIYIYPWISVERIRHKPTPKSFGRQESNISSILGRYDPRGFVTGNPHIRVTEGSLAHSLYISLGQCRENTTLACSKKLREARKQAAIDSRSL